MFRSIFFLFILMISELLLCEFAFAEVAEQVEIIGAKRVERNTILSYLPHNLPHDIVQEDLDNYLKKLYNSGLFSEVAVEQEGKNIVVQVVENPVINKVSVEGNSKIKTEDILAELSLKPRTVFSKNKAQIDVERLRSLYFKEGLMRVRIEPKLIKLDNNRVNVVMEIEEGKKLKIESITFSGNRIYKSNKLRSVIVSKVSSILTIFSSVDKYDADRIEFDKELLRKFYVSNGYADFKVVSAIASLGEGDGMSLNFAVEEGRKYRFGAVDLNVGIASLKESAFAEAISTREGEIYSGEKIEATVGAITKILAENGYAFVDVDPDFERNLENSTINVRYNIREVPRIYINKINIGGNVRTLDKVIRREFRIAEGDPYNAGKIKRSEQRIKDLNFFEKATLTPVRTEVGDKIDLNLEVVEKSTGDINFGGGYSTSDGFLFKVGVKEKNLIGTGKELGFSYEKAQKKQNFEISFTDPYLFDRDLSFGFDLYNIATDKKQTSSYTSEKNGGRLRWGYDISEYFRHSLSYNIDSTDIKNVRTSSRAIREQAGKTVTSGVGQVFTYDKRNSKIYPSDGYYFRLSQDLTGLGGNSRYIRHDAKASYYYPIWREYDLVWRFSVSGGNIFGHSREDRRGIRIFERFFLGGDDVRGFKNAGIGPRDTSGNYDSLGGNSYYLFNTEFSFPIGLPDEFDISGSVFLDAGSLFGLDDKNSDVIGRNDGIRVSTGIGLVWVTRVGPFRLDYGIPLVKYSYDRTQSLRFSFSTGI